MSLKGKTVVLGVTGSIAAYKACELTRRLKDRGADVHCIMTQDAAQFVTPLSLSVLSQHPVASDAYDPELWHMAHLSLAQQAHLLLIAPASANTIARLAHGFASDLLSLTALATKAPLLIVPAMHDTMWEHPLTQANVASLKKIGAHFVGPVSGALANQETGLGRLADVDDIVREAEKLVG